jgi:hypothetical protein
MSLSSQVDGRIRVGLRSAARGLDTARPAMSDLPRTGTPLDHILAANCV